MDNMRLDTILLMQKQINDLTKQLAALQRLDRLGSGGTLTGGGTVNTGGYALTIGTTSYIAGSVNGYVSGGGTVNTGGYALTVPATGTAALLGAAQTFTALNTFSAGISLGDETLSVYDEGTFTPIVSDLSGGGNAASGTFTGRYVKIGPVVHTWISLAAINTTGMTAGSNLNIRNLPFVSANVSGLFPAGATATSFITITGAGQVVALVTPNSQWMRLYEVNSAGDFTTILVSDLTSGFATVHIQVTYLAAS